MLQTFEARGLTLEALTPQERECLKLVAQQRSSKEIARELGISKASVDTYCNRARAKLRVGSRRAAAQLYLSLEALAAPPSPPPAAPAPLRVSLLPPLSSLGPVSRIGIIFGGAAVLALAFGMLLTGMQTLDGVAHAARAKAALIAGASRHHG
jgi:DNA-binding CsgD family transcriptional regulator